MLRRALSPSGVLVLVFVAAAVLVACGDMTRQEGPTGPVAVSSVEGDGVTASRQPKGPKYPQSASSPVCHLDADTDSWIDILLPSAAVAAHLAHGDFEGECCPCYTPEDIAAFAACPTKICQPLADDPAGLALIFLCPSPTGTGTGIGAGFVAGTSSCRYSPGTPGPEVGYDPSDQNLACRSFLESSGYCPS